MQKNIFKIIMISILLMLLTGSILAEDSQLLTLEDILSTGLEKNTGIIEGEFDRDIARQDFETARKNLWPEISINSTYTRLDEGPLTMDGFDTQKFEPIYKEGSPNVYNTQLSLQQPIYMGGQIRLGIDLAEERKSLADVEYNQKKSQTLLNLIESYYNVLMAEKRIEIEEKALELVKEQKKAVQASYDAGMAVKTDVLQVEIEEGNALHSFESAQDALYLAKKSLSKTAGINDHQFVLKEPEISPQLELDLETMQQKAIGDNSQLQMLAINKTMTETNLEMEKKSRFPQVALAANYSWQDDKLSFEDGSWDVSLSLSLSLFDGGKSDSEQRKIKKQLEKLEETRENAQSMIELDIENIMLDIEQNLKKIELQRLNVEKAEENFELQSKRYEAGMGKNIDVLSAGTVLKQAEIEFMQSEYQYIINQYKLLQKTGNLIGFYEEVIK